MSHHRSLRLEELAELLKIGEKTLNVWRHRYGRWIPQTGDGQHESYPEESVDIFRLISKCTHAGMEPEDIERVLSAKAQAQDTKVPPEKDGPQRVISPDLSALADRLQGFFADIAKNQNRIADAQERRASAEERKAYALESRAEAELIKANALKDVAACLKDLTAKDAVSSLMEKVKSIHAPSPAELGDFLIGSDMPPEVLENLPELEEEAILGYADEKDFRDQQTPDEEEVSAADIDMEPALRDVDDLSLLIDDEIAESRGPKAKDDAPVDVDDLSMLLDPEDLKHVFPPALEEVQDIDDLSLLIDDEPAAPSVSAKARATVKDVDDLSKLIDPDDMPPPAAKPKKTVPEPAPENKEDYKSKILKRIIQMKQKDHLSVEETTRRFNEEGVKTLSGKGAWDQKTIQGIYKYIDSVQAK